MTPVSQSSTRRQVSLGLAAGLLLMATRVRSGEPPAAAAPATVSIENFSAAGVSQGVVGLPAVVRSAAEWRRRLTPAAYDVTREEGTERAFSGQYADYHGDGLYRCVCCDTPLFDSRTKFESGTGWPSFWRPLSPHNVVETTDRSFFMQRTAVSCRRCNAHLGHVFDDGPKPTGLRYCMNSVALRFYPRT